MSKHTPTPWRLEATEDGGRILACDDRETIIHVPPGSPHNEQVRADAELIVRAVNAHEDMLAALKEAATQFHFYAEQHAAKGTDEAAKKASVNRRMAAKMEAAIACAEGREP